MNKISDLVEVHVFRIIDTRMETLILKRSINAIYPGIWQMVTGRIEKGEMAFESAIREVKEETNLVIEKLWVVPKVNSFYSEKDDSIHQIPVFAVKAKSNSNVQLSSEHSNYKWVDYKEACNAFAWKDQKDALKMLVDYYINKKEYLDLLEITF